MRNVIEKLRAEKVAIETRNAEFRERQSDKIEAAYQAGMRTAETWIREASLTEIQDAIKRPDAKNDARYFSLMRSVYFTSLEKICPEAASRFKWTYNDAFLNGWREAVNTIWASMQAEINR